MYLQRKRSIFSEYHRESRSDGPTDHLKYIVTTILIKSKMLLFLYTLIILTQILKFIFFFYQVIILLISTTTTSLCMSALALFYITQNFYLPESCGDVVCDQTVDSVVTPGNQQHDHTNNAREKGYPVKKEKSSW